MITTHSKCPSIRIPGSKSLTHRALIAAGLARGKSELNDILICEDTGYTIEALKKMGIEIAVQGNRALVSGIDGTFPPTDKSQEIFLGNSGTSFRLLLSTAALTGNEIRMTGSPRMCERPIGDLAKALTQLGVNIGYPEKRGFPPLIIKGAGIKGGRVTVSGNISSQYLSSLLLAAPYAKTDVEIEVEGNLASKPYVDLTLQVMADFGIKVARDGYHMFKVPAGRPYQACPFTVEGDVSSASYFWAAAAVTQGCVTTENIYPHATRQGDLGLLAVFEQMGCQIEKKADRVTVVGRPLKGITVDMHAMPDMVPTLAAVALFAEGETVITHVGHLAYKESNRLEAVAAEWRQLGGRVEVLPDGLVIHGGQPLYRQAVDSHDDHRIAMSLAVIGLVVPGIEISDPQCVAKSFPGFWEMWEPFALQIKA